MTEAELVAALALAEANARAWLAANPEARLRPSHVPGGDLPDELQDLLIREGALLLMPLWAEAKAVLHGREVAALEAARERLEAGDVA